MSKIADIVRAIDAEGSTSWQIADELAELDEVDETTGKPITLAEVARRIYDERGVEWSPQALGKYRTTALTFPPDVRVDVYTFHAHMELRAHPDKLLGWKPKRAGDVLTVERARNLRGVSSAAKPKPDAWRAKVDRALGAIAVVAENDPGAVIEMLLEAIATLERTYPKATSCELHERPLRCEAPELVGLVGAANRWGTIVFRAVEDVGSP